jgi:protein phosphatase
MILLDIGCLSDKGNKRKTNQDRLFVAKNNDSALIVIADGMGGMESGEYASSLVVDKIGDWWNKYNADFVNCNAEKITDMMYAEVNDINNLIVEYCKKKSKENRNDFSGCFNM